VDNVQRQLSAKTAKGSGYRFKLVALAALALFAATYLAYQPASLSLGNLLSMLSRSGCDENQELCTSTPADAGSGRDTGSRAVAAGGQKSRHGDRPRALPEDPFNSQALRPGYTMAELCMAGLNDHSYRCRTGSYDGAFIASDSGSAPKARVSGESGHAISGRVLTADGIGLAGITIVAAPERFATGRDAESGTLRFWTVTDSLGAYSLDGIPDGEYSVKSRANGAYPSARISVRAGVDYADLVVSPNVARVAEGRVLDAAGKPLEGVTVLPVLPGQPSVLTGDDGRFRVPVRLKPTVKSFALRFQLPGFLEQTGTFEVPADATATTTAMKVVMQPVEAWTSVKGRVYSDSGDPLAGRTVELRPKSSPRSYKATTDSQGHFAFPVVESPADYRLMLAGGADHKDYQRSLHVTADMGELDVIAESYEFGAVTGELVNLSGEPVPDFALLVRNTGSRQPNALVNTDEHGNFEIPAAPAGKLVVASQSTPSILVDGLELKAGDKLHLPLVMDWGQHEIHGVVLNALGNPVPASRILLQWSHQADGITVKTTRRTAADTQGHFAFSRLGPGVHSLQIDAAGFSPVVIDHDVSRQGYELTVRLN